MFSHQKLAVYEKALTCVTTLDQNARSWDKRHAVVDHLIRASESILLNLVEGARRRGVAHRQRYAEYAIGSALECAACLDIAVLKGFLTPTAAHSEKTALCEVVKMLTGLRKSWAGDGLREEEAPYRAGEKLFAHERLEVYQLGLQFVRWVLAQPAGAALSSRLFRQLDKLATSAVLNIAEGNGRYGAADRHNFIDVAAAAATKSAAYVDLCWRNGELDADQRTNGIELLASMVRILNALSVA